MSQADNLTSSSARVIGHSRSEEMPRQAPCPQSRAYPRSGAILVKRTVRHDSSVSCRSGEPPLAAPAALSHDGAPGKGDLLAHLRARIDEIEKRSSAPGQARQQAWTIGAPEIDSLIGDGGLAATGLHEIKPILPGMRGGVGESAAASVAAALGFMLLLAVRRLDVLPQEAGSGRILWCWPAALAAEAGRLHGPGLAALGLDPALLILAETAREKDTLWALEEGLRSGSLALVVGMCRGIGLTPARRLALAAEASTTPALLLTCAREPAMGATLTRWRAGPEASGEHPLDGRAPGAVRLSLSLERCRNRPAGVENPPLIVEWSDASHRFSVVSRAGDRADGESRSSRHAS